MENHRKSEYGSNADPDTGSNTNSDAGSDPDPHTGPDADANTEADPNPNASANAYSNAPAWSALRGDLQGSQPMGFRLCGRDRSYKHLQHGYCRLYLKMGF
ncbi:MAG: hypothetical protein M0036_23505 [Desulfobacteraceae bacterium]|nr:hypothetical protein [Desulfobacteraceae bacterium]